jgi:hypothetical protein
MSPGVSLCWSSDDVLLTPKSLDFSPGSLEAIMAEEERKTLNKRFSGNNCPWFVDRRERADSFEVRRATLVWRHGSCWDFFLG